GAVPAGVTEIKSPTNIVWLIGRIQSNGPTDYENVRALQPGFDLTPLTNSPGAGARGGASASTATSDLNGRVTGLTPPAQVAQQDADAFFSAFAEALNANPPHADDAAFVTRLRSIGLVP